MIPEKNQAAVSLGRRDGLARMAALSESQRSALACAGGHARWAKERTRPPLHTVVTHMLKAIDDTGKPHVLFLENGRTRFCEAGSHFETLWLRTQPETCVGTYADGAGFSDVMRDVAEI